MSTQTVLSAPEEIDKEVQSDVKKMESPSPAQPKIEEKQIEPPMMAEEVKESSANEKPKAEDLAEDKPVELPPTEDAPNLGASEKDIPQVAKETVRESETTCISEATVNNRDGKSEEKAEAEPAGKQEETKEEPAKLVDVPDSSSAEVVLESMEKAGELPAKEVEATEEKDVSVSGTECKGEEASQPTPLVEEKPPKQSQLTEKFEKKPPAAHSIEKDTAEDANLTKEDQVSKEETAAIEGSKQAKSDTPKAQVQEKDVVCSTTDKVSEKAGEAEEEKESAKETVEVKGLSEGKVVEPGKIEEKTEIPEAKTEEKIVVAEELAQCKEKPIQDVTNSTCPPQVAEKAAEEEVTSRDIELMADNGNKKSETNDPQVEGKVEKESTKEPEQKIEETVQPTEANLEDEKQVDGAAKTDVQNSESTKDIEDIKTQDAPKENVAVKAQKQSNNIIKMVKQSLVKVKKAVIGKSQNSKTPASKPKDDTKK